MNTWCVILLFTDKEKIFGAWFINICIIRMHDKWKKPGFHLIESNSSILCLIKISIFLCTTKTCILLKQWFFFSFFIVIQVQLSPFLPHHSSPPHLSTPPTLKPTHFGFVHVSFIHVPWWAFPHFAPLTLSPLPSGFCEFVLYFNVSGCILLTCLFCWLGSTYRWDHMIFVFHCLAYFT